MMPLERRIVDAVFQKKGFVRSAGDYNFFTYHMIDGKKTSVWTKTSRGSGHKTLDDSLVSAMAKQCGLTNSQFKQLVECPLSQAELEQILVSTGRIKSS